nr:DNA methyltransferase [Enterococcus lactis]
MYPRLKLARNLLSESGVIFISIGEEEIDNLKIMMKEIYGELNFVTTFVWEKKKTIISKCKRWD